MLRRAIKTLGKSLLILAGVSYGVVKAMDLLTQEWPNVPSVLPASPPVPSPPEAQATAMPDHLAPDHPVPEHRGIELFRTADALQRLEGMEERLIRIENGLDGLISPTERTAPQTHLRNGETFVTRAEQAAALEHLATRMEAEIERRFEVQNRSVQSLRAMVARTDELLEKVIESIESTSLTA